jgi:hypothetical protein
MPSPLCRRKQPAKRLRARTGEPVQRGQSGGGERERERGQCSKWTGGPRLWRCEAAGAAGLRGSCSLAHPFPCVLYSWVCTTDGRPPRKKQKTSHPGPFGQFGTFGRLARRVRLGLQRLGPRAPEVVRRTLGAGETGSGRPSFLAQDNVHYLLRESCLVFEGALLLFCVVTPITRSSAPLLPDFPSFCPV